MLDKFPTISYQDSLSVTDITQRVPTIDKQTLVNYFQQQNQRPDTIASQIYNDSFLDWTVVVANSITNPLDLSVIDDNTFNDIITQRYQSVENAQQQIAFWENNWKNDPNPITPLQYNSLDPSVQSLYDPVTNVYGSPTQYVRKHINLRKSTSQIATIDVSNCPFPVQTYIQIKQSSLVIGTARIVGVSSDKITVDHVRGLLSGDYISDKITTLAIAGFSIVVSVISDVEVNFYSPVTIYDNLYRQYVESRRNIKIITPSSVSNVVESITSTFQ